MSHETTEPTLGGGTEGVLPLGVEANTLVMNRGHPVFLNRILNILPWRNSSEPISLADTLRSDIQKVSKLNGVNADPYWNETEKGVQHS